MHLSSCFEHALILNSQTCLSTLEGRRPPAAQALLEEYETSGDVGEAARCLRELGVPSYHHELVRRALAAAFAAPKHAPALRALLAALAGSGQITQVSSREKQIF